MQPGNGNTVKFNKRIIVLICSVSTHLDVFIPRYRIEYTGIYIYLYVYYFIHKHVECKHCQYIFMYIYVYAFLY